MSQVQDRRGAARLAGLALAAGLVAGCGSSAADGPSEASIKANERTSEAWKKATAEESKNGGRAAIVRAQAAARQSANGSQAGKYMGQGRGR